MTLFPECSTGTYILNHAKKAKYVKSHTIVSYFNCDQIVFQSLSRLPVYHCVLNTEDYFPKHSRILQQFRVGLFVHVRAVPAEARKRHHIL